jgi:hypothetical protein
MTGSRGAAQVDFAVVGNAYDTLLWLRRVLAGHPGVRLLEDAPVGGSDGPSTGVVATSATAATELVGRARRVAVVFEDPVRLLAEDAPGSDDACAPGSYATVVARLQESLHERPLVFAAEELAGSPPQMAELFAHFGIASSAEEMTCGPRNLPELAAGHRLSLFATVRDDVEELERLSGRTFRVWRGLDEAPGIPPPVPGAKITRQLVYCGRRRDVTAAAGATVLTDWDVLPVRLAPLLEQAGSLTVLDPMSFPFDALRDTDWGIPLAVQLPPQWSATELIALLGEVVCARLGAFDAVGVADDAVWTELRWRYSWPAEIRASERELVTFPAWSGARTGARGRKRKTVHQVLRGAVAGQLQAARKVIPRLEVESVVVVADDFEPWGPLFRLGQTELTGSTGDPGSAHRAAAAYPEWRFAPQLNEGAAEPESAHIAVAVLTLCDRPAAERAHRLRALWRRLRVGGRLIVVDRFLDGGSGLPLGRVGPRALLGEILDVSARHVVLDHVQALRLPGEGLASIGVFAMTKLGRPERL